MPTAWGSRQFQKPVSWIVEDIRRVGQKQILFVDLNLVADKAYARELFTALIPLKVRWFGLSTVLIAHDRELMELMARSGCRGLLLGLEIIMSDSLGDANKRFNGSVDYKALIADLHDLHIAIQGCFVFGLDHDPLEVFDITADFAVDNGIDLPRFAILTPFPGTPLHQRLAAENRILTRDWELYDGQHVVFQPRNMTPQQLPTDTSAHGRRSIATAPSPAASGRRAPSSRSASPRTSVTASTRITCNASTTATGTSRRCLRLSKAV